MRRRPGWRRLRAAALRRDGGRCQRCGAEAVEVHHVVPMSAGGADTLDNVLSLCEPCHAREHDGASAERRAWRESLAAMVADVLANSHK